MRFKQDDRHPIQNPGKHRLSNVSALEKLEDGDAM